MNHEFPAAKSVVRTVLIVVAVLVVLYLIYLLRKPIGWLLIAAFLAIAFAAANVVGGYAVTDRMLRMFKQRRPAAAETERVAPSPAGLEGVLRPPGTSPRG